ncbi:hypothetical protein SY89_03012 [Halolamina pelagica]|uniref:Uncharacterized protein n=1 Tax=Halolamina pelagica TaxID=699431 RepID=A0A0P7I5F6_9EURY|nr:hypothetical protein [Halolamina pelagica]KPN32246.1 hypothetical protein SY89_03012 [Halolamina pelagica]
MARKVRRNVSLDPELDEWLATRENASKLVRDLLAAYRAYGGDEAAAVRYVLEKEVHELVDEFDG